MGFSRLGIAVVAVAIVWSFGFNPCRLCSCLSRYFTSQSSTESLCNSKAPCHDVVMTLFLDGPQYMNRTPGVIEKRYALAGLTKKEAIQEGRRALTYFEKQYGITFGKVDDEALLDPLGTITSDDDTATLIAGEQNAQARYRLYTASVGTETQFYNAPVVGDGAWIAMISQDRPAAGKFNRPLPKGAAVCYGAYVIDQCPEGRDPALCERSILTPHNPRETIFIRFHTDGYFAFGLEPTNYFFLDLVLDNERWGTGRSLGYGPIRHDTRFKEGFEQVSAVRNILSWPAYAPYNGV